MKHLYIILSFMLVLTGCSNTTTNIDPREHLVDEEELDDSEKMTQSTEEIVSENALPTTVFYSDNKDDTFTYDYVYMMYTISSDMPPVGVHRKVRVHKNEYSILEDDAAVLTADKGLAILKTDSIVPQDIIIKDRSVVNNTLEVTKTYSELGIADVLTYLNNLDVGVSENGINGTLFIPDIQYANRPYSVEIERNEDGTPSIIRLIGFGTGVTDDDIQFKDFATYEFSYD